MSIECLLCNSKPRIITIAMLFDMQLSVNSFYHKGYIASAHFVHVFILFGATFASTAETVNLRFYVLYASVPSNAFLHQILAMTQDSRIDLLK